MADFVKVAKEYARLCNSFNNCEECPLNKVRSKDVVCRYWVLVGDSEKAEEAIMQWAKEHPLVTNRVKFKEVFGCDPILLDFWNQRGGDWLMEEYKEPKDDE